MRDIAEFFELVESNSQLRIVLMLRKRLNYLRVRAPRYEFMIKVSVSHGWIEDRIRNFDYFLLLEGQKGFKVIDSSMKHINSDVIMCLLIDVKYQNLKMYTKKIGIIMMLIAVSMSFSKGCNKYDVSNMNRCTGCQNGYYLNRNRCFRCPSASNIPDCQVKIDILSKDSKTTNPIRITEVPAIITNELKVQSPKENVNQNNETIKTEVGIIKINEKTQNNETQKVQSENISQNSTTSIMKVQDSIISNNTSNNSNTSASTNVISISTKQANDTNNNNTISNTTNNTTTNNTNNNNVNSTSNITNGSNASLKAEQQNKNDQNTKDNFFNLFGLFNCITLSMDPKIHCIQCKEGYLLTDQFKCQQRIVKETPSIDIIVAQAPVNSQEANRNRNESAVKKNDDNQDLAIRNVFIPIQLIHGQNPLNTPLATNAATPAPSNTNTVTPAPSTTASTIPARPLIVNIPIVQVPKTSTINTQVVIPPKAKAVQDQKIQMPIEVQFKDVNCVQQNIDFSMKKPVSINNKRCAKCFTSFYFNLNRQICMPYDPLCKTVNQLNECLSCYAGYNLSNSKCTTRTTQSVVNGVNGVNTSPSKPLSARNGEIPKKDFDPNCQKYVPNSFRCQICSIKYFLHEQKLICNEVDPSCKTWDANGYCTSCYDGYSAQKNERKCSQIKILKSIDPLDVNYQKMYCLRTINNKCVKCSFRYYLRNGICLPVDDLCKDFHVSFGYCTTCYHGYYLSNGECLQIVESQVNTDPYCDEIDKDIPLNCISCVQGYFLSEEEVCQPVSVLCTTYDDRNGYCTSCILNYTLDEGTGTCFYTNN